MNTSAQLATALSKRMIWKRDASAPYPCVPPPLSKKQPTAGKAQMKTYPVNSEHLCTADHRYK